MLAAIKGLWNKPTVKPLTEGERLALRIKALGLSVPMFARLHGVNRATITRYIQGKRKITSSVLWNLDKLENLQTPQQKLLLATFKMPPRKWQGAVSAEGIALYTHVVQQELGLIPAKRRATHAVSYPPYDTVRPVVMSFNGVELGEKKGECTVSMSLDPAWEKI